MDPNFAIYCLHGAEILGVNANNQRLTVTGLARLSKASNVNLTTVPVYITDDFNQPHLNADKIALLMIKRLRSKHQVQRPESYGSQHLPQCR